MPLSTAVFKTAVIDHSTISPFYPLDRLFGREEAHVLLKSSAKVVVFCEMSKYLVDFFIKMFCEGAVKGILLTFKGALLCCYLCCGRLGEGDAPGEFMPGA